ncbi:kinesin-like protein KIN-14F isoform X2 [Spinacia oleracea]|uniref:Kinesin-like protein KIN-14F isoform X2 n=1 Tax=Spinacia oleracea TaxID=3562 RepID=A0A9R0JP22_SPIOL|nr:kinesin-like protein KIN-14F isoform X2 [Spinacia oleracea]
MRQEKSTSNAVLSPIPNKNFRGLKALLSNNNTTNDDLIVDDMISDHELALRKAGESAARRYQATGWLREMDQVARDTLPKDPSEERFCLALRNGLILCNVLNKVNPGAVLKVVDNPVVTVQSPEGAAQSAIQYFENMRNFLVTVGNMKLLTFEASDLEKGGSTSKVVDCILCLKGYYEWKQAGGIGVWRYGGTVRITSFPKDCSSSSVGSESADDSLSSFDEYESLPYEQLSEFLHRSSKVSKEESEAAKSLCFLLDRYVLGILQAYVNQKSGVEDLPLNSMVIDIMIRKVVKDLSAVLVSQGVQLGLMLKNKLKSEAACFTHDEFLEAISRYLGSKMPVMNSDDAPECCVCGGRKEVICHCIRDSTSYKAVVDEQQKQLLELKSSFTETRLEVKKAHVQWDEEIKKLENHVKSLEVASSSYYKILEENRQLYNQVQDLKGSIRVYCRVRPFLHGQSDRESTVDHIGENGNIMIVHPHKQGKDARKIFSFNKVFGTNATQQQIYADTQSLIRSVLDGFNVCIFAYGQTGSGKTYTMSGPDFTAEDTWGVNYRALQDLFQISKSRINMIEYEIRVQMIEIYNEQVRDLLVVDGSSRRLDIRNNSQLNGLNVPDACLVHVNCTKHVLDLMGVGLKNRAVGATALNERSSRSHSILTIHVQGKELITGSILRGCLHLVDLAGSERVDKSEAVGERLKEAQHINKSLSALGDVISALAQKNAHIPYRNSKLTQVLQDSLGGQAKTLMFVHINPESNAIGETISTLKFAERVASIELGAARANKETTELRDLKAEISNLKSSLEKKEAELEHLKCANVRSNSEIQKARPVSPVHVPRLARPVDDKSIEVRSCSSSKQRRSRFPSGFKEHEPMPKMPFIAEEKLPKPGNPRSPSPPVRRSMSTDRGILIRSRLKPEITEKPVQKVQYPASARSVSVNKHPGPPQGNPLVDLYDGNLLLNQENEQLKPVLNTRQMLSVRKSKHDINKPKTKNQQPATRIPKVDETHTLLTDIDTTTGGKIDEGRKSDFSEPENENGLFSSPMYSRNSRLKKLQANSTKSSQYLEPSCFSHAEDIQIQ